MMFNGLLMCAEPDNIVLKESASASYADADAAHYYHSKLMSTLQVLQNKEETIQVQAESLREAESQIAELLARVKTLKTELDEKAHELKSRQSLETSSKATSARAQSTTDRDELVRVLRTNVSVMEDLYRDCFYENAKQEEMIEMLRKSYLDVRLENKRREQSLGSFSSEVSQDIVMEVDNLKMEISNFLNSSSNNDSGVWERSEDSLDEVGAGLQDLKHQLQRLQTVLTDDCTCGLEKENGRLTAANEIMEVQIKELRHKVAELESGIADKEEEEKQLKEEKQQLEEQVKQLEATQQEKDVICKTYLDQLQQTQAALKDQSAQIQGAGGSSHHRSRCQGVDGEDRSVTSDCARYQAQAKESERRVRQLAGELSRLKKIFHDLHHTYRDRAESAEIAAVLQEQLVEAHARGAELCADVRECLAAVNGWLRHTRNKHREQNEKITEQEALICSLRNRLENNAKYRNDASNCHKCAMVRSRVSTGAEDVASCSKYAPQMGERREECSGTSGSDKASQSSSRMRPRRLLLKNSCCEPESWCPPRPRCPHAPPPVARTPPDMRELSPTRELEQRVSALQSALERSRPRWAHARDRPTR